MKTHILYLLTYLFGIILLSGCNTDSDSGYNNSGYNADNSYSAGGYDTSTASQISLDSLQLSNQMADSSTMAQDAKNGDINFKMEAFGRSSDSEKGKMSGMGDIETLIKGNDPAPKDYKPRFLLVGEVNITVMTSDGNSTFYHLASVYDDHYDADDYVPKSQFKRLDEEGKMEIRIVGAPVWQDKLVQNFYMTIKFKVPLPVNMDGPDGVNREYIPMGQYQTVFYPHNMQNMVQTGGQEYYWGYLMGGGGYYFVAETNQTIQFAFGAFILPE